MPIVRAQVTIPKDSGIPADAVQNVWHFNMTSADVATAALVSERLQDFYDAVDNYMSTKLDIVNTSVEYFDLSQPTPRQPFHTEVIGGGMVTATTALPDEVALCLSFQAAPVSGVPQARRRGRIYLGPLSVLALGDAPEGDRPAAALVTALSGAGDALLTQSEAAVGWDWVVYSRVLNTAAVVADGWVDNSFDTQRRRGVEPTSRATFT